MKLQFSGCNYRCNPTYTGVHRITTVMESSRLTSPNYGQLHCNYTVMNVKEGCNYNCNGNPPVFFSFAGLNVKEKREKYPLSYPLIKREKKPRTPVTFILLVRERVTIFNSLCLGASPPKAYPQVTRFN